MDAFRHVTPPPLQTQQKPRVTEAQHNAEKYFLLDHRTPLRFDQSGLPKLVANI